MVKEIAENKIVVFTGAGVSAESGLKTFRDSDGLWNNYLVSEVATPLAWEKDPKFVLDFYNERRAEVFKAEPNRAHLAIAELEQRYEVVVVTQNIDDLHERAGSSNVIHLHGEISKARSTVNENTVIDLDGNDINIGDVCEEGGQFRPHIVWFGEHVFNYDVSRDHIRTAKRILVIGSSLVVQPAASLLKRARHRSEKIIVAYDVEKVPFGYRFIRSRATSMVPHIVNLWLKNQRVI